MICFGKSFIKPRSSAVVDSDTADGLGGRSRTRGLPGRSQGGTHTRAHRRQGWQDRGGAAPPCPPRNFRRLGLAGDSDWWATRTGEASLRSDRGGRSPLSSSPQHRRKGGTRRDLSSWEERERASEGEGGLAGPRGRATPSDPGTRPGPDICQRPSPARTLARIGTLHYVLIGIRECTHW